LKRRRSRFAIARFLTHDPVRQYVNPYAYVGWNPVKFTDPTGLIFGLGGDLNGGPSTYDL